ncbi:hypothetical protein TNCV_362291 [Trichonephila clavipes]|nr:hypothetical protein TNCV_362291 [Trichonephila clavipes]
MLQRRKEKPTIWQAIVQGVMIGEARTRESAKEKMIRSRQPMARVPHVERRKRSEEESPGERTDGRRRRVDGKVGKRREEKTGEMEKRAESGNWSEKDDERRWR